jgi:hypothetical protein
MRILEDGRKYRGVERLYARTTVRVRTKNICKVGIKRESQREGVSVMHVPSIHKRSHRLSDSGAVCHRCIGRIIWASDCALRKKNTTRAATAIVTGFMRAST